MSTPPKKHNCPVLDFFKGCGCCSSTPEQPGCGCGDRSHDHDHAHQAGQSNGQGHAHGRHHDHEHPHTHPHGGHEHGAAGSGEHSHAHGHDHAHAHEHDQEHGHSHEAAAAPADDQTKTETGDAGQSEQEVSAEQKQALRADLEAFEKEPAEFMERLPPKRTEQQGETPEALPLFSPEAIEKKAYVGASDELRTLLDSDDGERATRAAFMANDQARNLVDSYSHSSLQSMQASGLMRARLSVTPWSDDYWGLYLGCLGKRYADPGFPHSQDWLQNYNYVQSRPASGIVSSGSAADINNLSPSEKYDIFVGDSSFSLTRQMWADGQRYQQQYGYVETWMGICHGWAPASYMLPRPTKAVTLTAADGRTQLTFYPSDIKALASLLWAKASPGTKFIGGRCNVVNPETDSIGRVIAQDCFDTNPGTWHLAVVNQIGASKRSMVMDVTFDYQVWNQPTVGYRYYHFNPKSMTYQSSIAAAAVPRASFTNDKFARYRSSQTASIVGIEMYVSYTVETAPSHSMTDGPGSDAITEARYLYDLELDISGRIIGGEWRSKAHPDFLWTPSKGSRAEGSGSGVPQAAVVERLINLANS